MDYMARIRMGHQVGRLIYQEVIWLF